MLRNDLIPSARFLAKSKNRRNKNKETTRFQLAEEEIVEAKENLIYESGSDKCPWDISGVTSINDSPVAVERRLDLWCRPTCQDPLL